MSTPEHDGYIDCPRCGSPSLEHRRDVEHVAQLVCEALLDHWERLHKDAHQQRESAYALWSQAMESRPILGCIVWNLGRDLAAQQLRADAAGFAFLAESVELTKRLAEGTSKRLVELVDELGR